MTKICKSKLDWTRGDRFWVGIFGSVTSVDVQRPVISIIYELFCFCVIVIDFCLPTLPFCQN